MTKWRWLTSDDSVITPIAPRNFLFGLGEGQINFDPPTAVSDFELPDISDRGNIAVMMLLNYATSPGRPIIDLQQGLGQRIVANQGRDQNVQRAFDIHITAGALKASWYVCFL